MKPFIRMFIFSSLLCCTGSWRHAEIQVSGNCEMCREKIEAALKIPGVQRANWSAESKILELYYDESSITMATIRRKLADTGYDSDSLRAADSVYSQLHECCRYREKQP